MLHKTKELIMRDFGLKFALLSGTTMQDSQVGSIEIIRTILRRVYPGIRFLCYAIGYTIVRIDCPGRTTELNLGLFRASTCPFRLAISSLLMATARWTVE